MICLGRNESVNNDWSLKKQSDQKFTSTKNAENYRRNVDMRSGSTEFFKKWLYFESKSPMHEVKPDIKKKSTHDLNICVDARNC